mmetsp:Transcript_38712/g.64336  ORF Transcript_38712/g.64336 Transcript_38712/m.64336 type:complete len:126 (-) Transcript_38712:711-1088(-)
MADKVLVVVGYGTGGISEAVTRLFGAKGFKAALVARTADKLAKSVEELAAVGILAKGYPTDCSNSEQVRATFKKIHLDLGPIARILQPCRTSEIFLRGHRSGFGLCLSRRCEWSFGGSASLFRGP